MKLPVVENSDCADAKRPWYAQDGLRFTCTQCGNCCTGGPGFVWISEEEVRRLAEYLKLSIDETMDRHCRKIGDQVSLKEHRNRAGQYDCDFLKEVEATHDVEGQTVRYMKRVCTIYPVRPLQCRTWPFWDEVVDSPKSWAIAHRKCPGMNEGKRWSFDEVERIRTSPDWPDRAPGSK